MTLYCDCECDVEPGSTVWEYPQDYTVFPGGRRAARCCSCGERVKSGDFCTEFRRWKAPDTDIEVRIYGEDGEIPRASWWMCEECSDLFWSLTELGFCFDISTPMRKLVQEYAEEYR